MTSLHLDGGFGYLTNMNLYANGKLIWCGSEPGRGSASVLEKTLPATEVEALLKLAGAAATVDNGVTYRYSQPGNALRLEFQDGSERTYRLSGSEGHPPPRELSELLDALWKTRRDR